ncbi:uncharacterized protein LOC116348373 [Contarinia nasturtii]|uniref:uncharacterized protein LOC116348373 n=1 Tax=Contarinia nasturtii TaxID=265458 RepID=UPI0012D3CE12|nr:uncharacterized protein LOC116348373 [Contarinia nasturtii]
MIIITVFFTLFLIECNAVGDCWLPSEKDFNVDDFQYEGDPIYFACINDVSQLQFHITKVENGSLPLSLIDALDNGKGLSLFFHGISFMITDDDDLDFEFAQDWFLASKNNVCVVSYDYEIKRSIGYQMYWNLKRMVSTKRLEYVAKQARDLVLGIRHKCLETTHRQCLRHMGQVDASGFSFGAHIAGRFCEYLQEKTGEQVRILLALDPSKSFPLSPKPTNTIISSHAEFVQVIHTSMAGISHQIPGVSHIFVDYTSSSSFFSALSEKHVLGFLLHVATATKRLYIIADKNGNGRFINGIEHFDIPELKENECLVGIYAPHGQWNCGGRFEISLKNQTNILWAALGHFTRLL